MEAHKVIRERRIQLGITQNDLADRLAALGHETSYSRISHWETGRNTPPVEDRDFRLALASALEISEVEMMRRFGFVVESHYSEIAERAAAIVDRLTDEKKEIAMKLLETLL